MTHFVPVEPDAASGKAADLLAQMWTSRDRWQPTRSSSTFKDQIDAVITNWHKAITSRAIDALVQLKFLTKAL
jgi:hypothetical protein